MPRTNEIEPSGWGGPQIGTVRPGSLTRTTSRPQGRTLTLPKPAPWQHPWQIVLLWDGTRQLWTSTVKAGFLGGPTVGCACPVYRTTVGSGSTPQSWPQFGINPLTGEPFFSDSVFIGSKQASSVTPGTPIDIPLFASPLIDLDFYNIGVDGDVDTAVPQFFQNLGVGLPSAGTVDEFGNVTVNAAATPGNRLLRGCDIVLHQPHVALTSTITMEPGLLTGISNVAQTLGLQAPDPTDTLKVYAAAPWSPPTASAGIDPLSGDYIEPTYDEVLVGTAYLMSAPNAAPFSAPDQTWQPFTRHGLFWNLSWAQPKYIPPPQTNTGLPLIVTGDPFAQLIINYEVASINDAFQNAVNILDSASMAGFFWSPTGGGTTSVFPPAAPSPVTAPSGAGLDKNGYLQAQRIAALQALVTQQLDPDFPFTGMPFNLSLLNS